MHDSQIAGFCDADEIAAGTGRSVIRFPRGRLRWFRDRKLRELLGKLIAASDGLHIHGIWEEHCATAASLASAARKPYVVSAHGMLEKWAISQKWLKKALYSAAIERPNLSRATCLRALTRAEVDDYRRFGLSNPIALIPNGVDAPVNIASDTFLERHPGLTGKQIVLFLSRLIYKKGPDLLCRAWAGVSPRFPEAHLVIAGPDYGERAAIERLVAELRIQDQVTFVGMLAAPLKWSALAAASAFVLPSRSEGFSMAVLEAIAAGLPTIITHHCNFPEVANTGCGWVIEASVAEIQNSLKECLQASAIQRARMGEAGRSLARERYSWPVIGRQMAELYSWINGGSRPMTVDIF